MEPVDRLAERPARGAVDAPVAPWGSKRRAGRIAARVVGGLFAFASLVVVVGVGSADLWARPLARRWVLEHAGRSIDFASIALRIDRTGRPTVRLHDLRIENAAWATDAGPLIRAGTIEFVFDWSAFGGRSRTVPIRRLRLVDASVDLERQADGLRNWRLGDPEDRGPGRFRVETLDAERSRIRFVHRGLGLETELRFGALAPATAAASGAGPLRPLLANGTRDRVPFDVALETGPVLSFYGSGVDFAWRGSLRTAGARLAIDGRARDLAELGGLDLRLHAESDTGAGPGELATLALGARAASTALASASWPSLAAAIDVARVVKAGREWRVDGFAARLGRSDVQGSGRLRQADRGAGGTVDEAELTLTSRRIDAAELRRARTRLAAPKPSVVATAGTTSTPASPPASAGSAGPRGDAARRSFDARIAWTVARIEGFAFGPIDTLSLAASGRDARWTLSRAEFQLAGGRVSGAGTLDAAAEPRRAETRWAAHDVRLERLGLRDVAGRLDARAAFTARGGTAAAMLASLAGEVDATLAGGSMPTALEAKIGLDLGRWFGTLVQRRLAGGGDARVAIDCAALGLRLDHGIARVRRLALDTADLRLGGRGSLDLVQRRIDLGLTPHRTGGRGSLLALDRSIRIAGILPTPSFALVDRIDRAADSCSPLPGEAPTAKR